MQEGKLSLIYIADILRKTDAENPITAGKICEILENTYGIISERRTVGRNIKALIDAGMDIIFCKDNKKGCYLASHDFKLTELKFLIDCVDNTEVLTEKEANDLRKKIINISSEGMKKVLTKSTSAVGFSHGMRYSGNTTNNNSKIEQESSFMEKLDIILNCISKGKNLSFIYADRDKKLNLKPRRQGKRYKVSPYVLILRDDKYYLVCNYNGRDGLAYYRLDKMIEPAIEEDSLISQKTFLGDNWQQITDDFIAGTVRGYGGKGKIILVLRIAESMISYFYDEFGGNIIRIQSVKDTASKVDIYINTTENDGLYYLLMQYGANSEVIAPVYVREKFASMVNSIWEKYFHIQNFNG